MILVYRNGRYWLTPLRYYTSLTLAQLTAKREASVRFVCPD